MSTYDEDYPEPRKVSIQMSNAQRTLIAEKTSGNELEKAIGYASMWGLNAYPEASIYVVRGEINCLYTGPGGRRFVMCGIPRDDGTISFHS